MVSKIKTFDIKDQRLFFYFKKRVADHGIFNKLKNTGQFWFLAKQRPKKTKP